MLLDEGSKGMDESLPQFHITDESPRLKFDYPTLWNAEKLLRDSEGESYAVAVEWDRLRGKPVLISGSGGAVVPLRRLFRKTENSWKLVEDKGSVLAALRVAEGR
jgi:hypothetical protein